MLQTEIGAIVDLMKPAEGTHLLILEDEGVLFSEATQQLYALNTAATFIWCCVEEGYKPSEIKGSLQRDFRLSSGESERLVADTLDLWLELGLFANAGDSERSAARERGEPPPEDESIVAPPYESPVVSNERVYRLLDSRFRVRFTASDQESLVHPMLAHLEDDKPGEIDLVVDIVEHDKAYYFYGDGAPLSRCDSLGGLAPCAKLVIWHSACLSFPHFISLHAGAVCRGDKCLLLPGPPGSGKTLLTAALAFRGLTYYSDETALLEESSFRVLPVPLPLGVKSSGWEILQPYFPDLVNLPIHDRSDGRRVRYLPPSAIPERTESHQGAKVKWIVFPTFEPESPGSLRPIKRSAALRRLFEDSLGIPIELDLRKVAELVNWMKSVECYALSSPNLEKSLELISDLVRE